MKLLHTISHAGQADLFDFNVLDKNNESIGTLHSMWNNEHTGELEFLGIKSGWLFGSNHVVPAEKAQIDEAARTIQVPYLLKLVKEAPTYDADAEINDQQEAEIYHYYGASLNSSVNAASVASTSDKSRIDEVKSGDDIQVPLSEEEVKVGKRTVAAGAVRLRKVVRTEIVNQPVEIRHEDFVVERVSADQVHAGTSTSDFKEEVIDVPLSREEVVVSKQAHVTGAVRLHKTTETETQNVSETVRKEDVEVVRDGEKEVASVETGRH